MTDHLAGVRGCSPNTIASYRDAFKLLICYFRDERGVAPERLTLELIDAAAIIGFLDWLATSRENSASTRNQRLAAIDSFFTWMQTQDPVRMACCQDILQIPSSKHDQPAIAHLTVEQTRRLLALPDRSTRQGRRDATLLATLYDTRRPSPRDRRPHRSRHPSAEPRDRRSDRQRPQDQAHPDRRQHNGAAGRLLLSTYMGHVDPAARVRRATPQAQGQPSETAVDLAKKRRLLGFRFFGREREIKVRIDPSARKRVKDRLRQLTSRKWGVSMEQRIEEINRYTVGWTNYYALADTPSVFEGLDEWLRRRLRQVRWKEWTRPKTKRRNLIALGIRAREATEWAYSPRATGASQAPQSSPALCPTPTGLTRVSRDSPIPTAASGDAERTAGCGPARPVVWGAPGEPGAYPIDLWFLSAAELRSAGHGTWPRSGHTVRTPDR